MELEIIFKMLSRSINYVMWYIMAFPVAQATIREANYDVL